MWDKQNLKMECVTLCERHSLDGLGIESQWGKICNTRPDRSWAHPASYAMSTVCFQGVKWPERGVDQPPTPSAEVKERVELYIYSPLVLRGLFQSELYLYFYIYVMCMTHGTMSEESWPELMR